MTDLPAPRVRQDRQIRRARLIDDSIQLIGRYGYHGFTVQALATQSGLTNAGVLHHFGSKDQLLLAVLDEIERRESDSIALVLVAATPETAAGLGPTVVGGDFAALTVFRAIIQRVVENAAQARFLAALQAESIDSQHPAHHWFAQREAETLGLFTRLAWPLHGEDAAAMARHLTALMYGYVLQWLRSDQGFDLVADFERAAHTALRPLLDAMARTA